MRVVKPAWLNHKGAAIYSVDIHPDGNRVVTGGHDGAIRLWSMDDIVAEEDATGGEDPTTLLCTLTNHMGSVLCVRWAPSGEYVASGSDDKLIMVWQLKGQGAQQRFGETNLETWGIISTLNRHTGDVAAVEWSQNREWLASCSIDNTVIIWALPNFTMAHVLKDHTGFVKGLAWDPVGKYLASQSADKTVRVWRTDNWECMHVVQAPFAKSTDSSFFQRLAWTVDGEAVFAACAKNAQTFVSKCLDRRQDFKPDVDLLGHHAPVVAVGANPIMFAPHGSSNPETEAYSVLALGSQDCSASVWRLCDSRPVVVMHDMFKDVIHDVRWSSDGRQMVACSGDGTACFLLFEDAELGKPLTPEQQARVMRKRYGGGPNMAGGIAESTTQLLYEQLAATATAEQAPNSAGTHLDAPLARPAKAAGRPASSAAMGNGSGAVGTAGSPAVVTQWETRTKDGRRRIAPMQLASGGAGAAAATTARSGVSTIGFGGPAEGGRASVVRKVAPVQRLDGQPQRKRGRPAKETPPAGAASASAAAPAAGVLVVPRVQLDYAKPPSTRSLAVEIERSITAVGQAPVSAIVLEAVNETTDVVGRHKLHRLALTQGGDTLWEQLLPSAVCLACGTRTFVAAACEHGDLHIFQFSGVRLLPPLTLGSPVSLLHGQDSRLSCVTSNGYFHAWDLSTCTSLFSALSLEPLLSDVNGSVVDAFLSKGASPVVRMSDASDTSEWPRAVRCYTYHSKLRTWLEVGNACSSVALSSMQHSTLKSSANAGEAMGVVQRGLDASGVVNAVALAHGLRQLAPGRKVRATISHLEYQLACAAALGDQGDYRRVMHRYIRFLATEDMQDQLKVVCEDHCGPPSASSSQPAPNQTWQPFVQGLPKLAKRELLRSILVDITTTNRALQRLVDDVATTLDEIEQREGHF